MSFEVQNKADIQQRLNQLLTVSNDKTTITGSFQRDLVNANSVEFEQAYAEMALMVEANFAGTSWGEYLTMRAAEYGVDRKAATKAVGELVFLGQPGSKISAGSLVTSLTGMQYTTDADATIGMNGQAKVKATCSTIGNTGNTDPGTISIIPMSIPGIRSASNPAAFIDGFDEESDADLLKRYYLKVRTPATSGNAYHYRNWALSIDGVGECKVIPLWKGPGTVEVLIVDSNMQTASAAIIKNVHDYIETVRPIGADVTVASPQPLPINVEVSIDGRLDAAALQKSLNEYFKSKNLELRYISAAQVGRLIMEQSSVADYEALTINGSAGRIDVPADKLPTAGEVVIHAIHS